MKKALLVIDVQNCFITPSAKNLPKKIFSYIKQNKGKFDLIVFTKFVNNNKSSVYRFLRWKKSMTSPETDFVDKLQPALKHGVIVSKDVYSALKAPKVKKLLEKKNIKKLYLCGMDTDSCILATAYDAFDQGYEVCLLENLSMSHAGETLHKTAISMFKRNVGFLAKT